MDEGPPEVAILVEYATDLRERGPLKKVALVRGEIASPQALKAKLRDAGIADVHAPPPPMTTTTLDV